MGFFGVAVYVVQESTASSTVNDTAVAALSEVGACATDGDSGRQETAVASNSGSRARAFLKSVEEWVHVLCVKDAGVDVRQDEKAESCCEATLRKLGALASVKVLCVPTITNAKARLHQEGKSFIVEQADTVPVDNLDGVSSSRTTAAFEEPCTQEAVDLWSWRWVRDLRAILNVSVDNDTHGPAIGHH